MVDAIVSYISSVDVIQRANARSPALRPNSRKVIYALCNSLGSIILVYDSLRVVRKANVYNQNDVRLSNPVNYLNNMASEVGTTVTLGDNATVQLLYCHRMVEKLGSHCHQLLLLGTPTVIVFADHRVGSEEAQQEHAYRCSCGHMCHSRPPSYTLRPGDRIVINSGHFFLSASSEEHCIFMTKSEFLGQITYSSEAGTESIMAFVNALPDTANPMVS